MTVTESLPVSINLTLPPREITIETIYKDIENLLENEKHLLEHQESELKRSVNRCKRYGVMWTDYNVEESIKQHENLWNEGIIKSSDIIHKLERCKNILNDNN